MKLGLIAGEGIFPVLVADSARADGHEVFAAAIKEEAWPSIEEHVDRAEWISLGELTKLIKYFQREGVTEAVMAGRVKHTRIYSAIRPDWRLLKLLKALPRQNTNSLIGAVADVLAAEGIHLRDSTEFLRPHMAPSGSFGARRPTKDELADAEYGLDVARVLAGFDVGQSVVICERACVAVEAMEGTDACILRAAEHANKRKLTVVKVARPKQDPRWDVPVVGAQTIEKMREAGATCLALEAAKVLLLERDAVIEAARQAQVALVGVGGDTAGN